MRRRLSLALSSPALGRCFPFHVGAHLLMIALSSRASLLRDTLQIAVVLRFWEEDVVTSGLKLSVQ